MSQDFERFGLKELFTDVEAFVAFSLGIIIGLSVLLWLMLMAG